MQRDHEQFLWLTENFTDIQNQPPKKYVGFEIKMQKQRTEVVGFG